MNAKHYIYRVFWSEEDQEYVGVCTEFPSLSWLDKDQAAALSGIVQLVKDTVTDMETNGEAVPEPLSKKIFSGKISLRTTPAVHRHLVASAMESGVSLNRYINALIGA